MEIASQWFMRSDWELNQHFVINLPMLRFIERIGSFTVVRLEVPADRSLNLLAHAQIGELDIGSQCGGFGECGGDRVRIAGGRETFSPITGAELEQLSAEEIAQGYRLACQCFPERSEDAHAGAEIEINLPRSALRPSATP